MAVCSSRLACNASTPDSCAWHLVHTKPRLEETALVNLERQGYECYLPTLKVEKIRRGKAAIVSEALFPRYLFVRLDTSGQGLGLTR
jgi:transcriptional antiterminator RfaH